MENETLLASRIPPSVGSQEVLSQGIKKPNSDGDIASEEEGCQSQHGGTCLESHHLGGRGRIVGSMSA